MATGSLAAPAVDGVRAVPSLHELAQYEKLIKLRDDIFAGRHPTLKLAKAPLSSVQRLGPLATNVSTFASNSSLHASLTNQNGSAFGSDGPNPTPFSNAPTFQTRTHGQLVPAPAAGPNPMLWERNPVLIAAEKSQSREFIENALTQEAKRRVSQWPKLDRENVLPEFDVDEILRKAQEYVKPVLIDAEKLAAKQKPASPTRSENSYYSSQANDEGSESALDQHSQNQTRPCTYYFKGKCFKGDDCKFSHDRAFEAQLKPVAPLTEAADRLRNNHTNEGPPSKRARRNDARKSQQYNGVIDLVADAPASDKRQADDQYQRDLARAGHGIDLDLGYENFRRANTPLSARREQYMDRRHSGRGMSPLRDVRDMHVVRNHITSPVAPQPARVSPLAISKGPRVDQIRENVPRTLSSQSINISSGQQQSPVVQQPLTRKRRRGTDVDDGSNSANSRRRVAPSKEVRVKEEPLSPQPLNDIPVHRHVQREEIIRQPVDLDDHPSYGTRVIDQEPIREIRYIDEPGYRRVSSPIIRVVSRTEPRFEVRREPELRRIVSERQPLRAASPSMSTSRESVYYGEQMRSHVPMYEKYPAPGAPPVASALRHEYPPEPQRVQSPNVHPQGTMPPPPPVRRIIRDRFGNEFFEEVAQEPRRYSVAPEPRYAPDTNYNPRPSSRMASIAPEAPRQYREATVIQRRQEPEPTSPRYVDYMSSARSQSIAPNSRMEQGAERPQVVRIATSGRAGAEDSYERVIREPPQPGYIDRPRDVHYDEPRRGEVVYRVQSVHPEGPRYVDADERYMRHTSMRPPPSGYERAAQPMAPPPVRYEYVDEWAGRGYGQDHT